MNKFDKMEIIVIYSVTCQLLVVFLAVFDQFSGRFSKGYNRGIQYSIQDNFVKLFNMLLQLLSEFKFWYDNCIGAWCTYD